MRASCLVGLGVLASASSCIADAHAVAPAPALRVQLASSGVVGLAIDDGSPLIARHVRVTIDNRGAAPAVLDASTSRVDDAIAPMLVNSDVATLPIAIVDRGEHATVDLYFPPDVRAATGFDVVVMVTAAGRSFATRAHFVATAAATPESTLGHARRWWGAPAFRWPTFRRQDGIITPHPPARVLVAHHTRSDS